MGNDGELSIGSILARMDKSTTNPYRSYKVFFDFLISFCVICTFVISHWRFYKEMQNPFFLSKPNLCLVMCLNIRGRQTDPQCFKQTICRLSVARTTNLETNLAESVTSRACMYKDELCVCMIMRLSKKTGTNEKYLHLRVFSYVLKDELRI